MWLKTKEISRARVRVKGVLEMAQTKVAMIKEDLKKQLSDLQKIGKYYDDLVDEYMYLRTVRQKLKKDIKEKGVRYSFINGNGKEQEKPNESIANLIKVEQIMLKIINDLGINQPLLQPTSNDDPKEEIGEERDLL